MPGTGRRSVSYKDWIKNDGLTKLEAWARDGLTDEQIAHNVGVARSTIAAWKVKHKVIADALKHGKEVVDIQVENALLKRALGYEYEEVKEIEETDRAGNSRIRIERTIKTVLPDTTAQIFWLKNRKPRVWRDRRNIEHSGGIDIATQSAKVEKFLDDLKD